MFPAPVAVSRSRGSGPGPRWRGQGSSWQSHLVRQAARPPHRPRLVRASLRRQSRGGDVALGQACVRGRLRLVMPGGPGAVPGAHLPHFRRTAALPPAGGELTRRLPAGARRNPLLTGSPRPRRDAPSSRGQRRIRPGRPASEDRHGGPTGAPGYDATPMATDLNPHKAAPTDRGRPAANRQRVLRAAHLLRGVLDLPHVKRSIA